MDMPEGLDNPSMGMIDHELQDQSTDEDVVNKYFYKLYMSQISTDQMIEVMHNLGNSPKGSRNRNIYNTMLKILFNECRFFPKYPVQQLAITAELFGKMIKNGLLLSNAPLLLLASRCILEALKRGKMSKMFQFGTIALSQFENSIASYPWFSNALLSIPDVKETFPQLYKTCEKLQSIMGEGMKNNAYVDQSRGIVIGINEAMMGDVNNNGNGNVNVNIGGTAVSTSSTSGNTHHQPTSGDEIQNVGEWEYLMSNVGTELTIVLPNDNIVNQIYAIFNNMCMDTVVQRANEIRSLLSPDNYSWLILYIVRTRACKENNLHETFAAFIENLHYPKIFDMTIQITHLCISASLKGVNEYKEVISYRTLLKNLGSWLGRITLARNVPIILRQLDIKGLLFNGYENGTLIAVLPFVCRAMEGIKHSKIFKPPNPWTTAILSFLAEIHKLEFLKTNLVFEIEVLFKHLSLDILQFENKTNLLSTKCRAKITPDFDTDNLINPDEGIRTNPTEISKERLNHLLSKVMKDGITSTTTNISTLHSNNLTPQPTTSVQLSSSSSIPVNKPDISRVSFNMNNAERLLQTLHTSVVISPSIALFEIQPQLRGLVPLAIERAIRNILPIVIDHSLSLARITTRELILKDFYCEEDENIIRGITKMVFENFASLLVLASCKEPLRIAFHDSLRAALQTHRTQDCNDQVLIEQLVQITSQDNMALSVNVIEKIVLDHAQNESENLAIEIYKLIKSRGGYNNITIALPPLLQHWNHRNIQRDGHGANVYKNIFIQSKIINNDRDDRIKSQSSKPIYDNVLSLCEECLSDLREPLRNIALFPPILYSTGPVELDVEPHIFSTHSLHVLYSLPSNHELFSCISQCISVIEVCSNRENVSVAISRCLMMFLCEGLGNRAGLNVEVLLCILNGLYKLNPLVKQTLSTMLFSLPLEQNNNLFNIVVVTGLLRYELLDWADLTQYLIISMDRGKNIYAVEMAIVVTAISLIDQRSAPPECGAALIREIASISCGSEPCKTYPDVLLKDAWAKLLKDYVEIQHQPRPTIISLIPILKKNLSEKMSINGFKLRGNGGLGYGGVRRVPLPYSLSESHKSVVSLLFNKWIETSTPYEGEALLFAWRQFFQRFNLQNLFKMEGGTDSFFSACIHTVIDVSESDDNNRNELLSNHGYVLAKMVDVMLRLVSGGDLPPSSALQKLLSAISSIIVHEDYHYGCYKIWIVFLNYFDKIDDNGLCKLTFLNGLEYINPTRAPSFAFFWFKILSHKTILNSLLNNKCWVKCAKVYTLASNFFNIVNPISNISSTPQYIQLKEIYKKLVSNICLIAPEFVSHHHLCFSGSRAIERLVSSCHAHKSKHYSNLVFNTKFNIESIPEMKNIPKLNNGVFNPIIKNGVKVLIEKVLKDTTMNIDANHNNIPLSNIQPPSSNINTHSINTLLPMMENIIPPPPIPHPPFTPPPNTNLLTTTTTTHPNTNTTLHQPTNTPPSPTLTKISEIIENELNEYPSDGIATLNALVLYIGVYKAEHGINRLPLYSWFMKTLSTKAKYHLICSLSRQLRYPNAHTHFYACLILWLFDETKNNKDKLIILRVLLEWFIAPGPCPWGITLVVVEIFRNPRFTHTFNTLGSSPKVNALLESINNLLTNTIS